MGGGSEQKGSGESSELGKQGQKVGKGRKGMMKGK